MNTRCKATLTLTTTTLFAVFAAAALADGKTGTATIKGKVMGPEKPANVRPIAMAADKFCAAAHQKPVMPQGKIVWDDGTVPYAFVYLKSADGKLDIGTKFEPPSDPIEIDQKGCMYSPHVQGMIAGQKIKIKNSDDTNHNIHSLPTKNRGFNFSQPKVGMERVLEGSETFTNPEVMVRVKCDVHPWMSAYVGVLPHPFFTYTKKPGTFEIPNVPAGKYILAVWHEDFGAAETPIEVAEGATVEQDLTLTKKAGDAGGPARDVTIATLSK
jgi:hypothetical protein